MINDVYVKELEQSLKISSTSALIFFNIYQIPILSEILIVLKCV